MNNSSTNLDINQLLQLSSMDMEEKAAWTTLIPLMNPQEKKDFLTLLEKEVQGVADIFLHILEQRK